MVNTRGRVRSLPMQGRQAQADRQAMDRRPSRGPPLPPRRRHLPRRPALRYAEHCTTYTGFGFRAGQRRQPGLRRRSRIVPLPLAHILVRVPLRPRFSTTHSRVEPPQPTSRILYDSVSDCSFIAGERHVVLQAMRAGVYEYSRSLVHHGGAGRGDGRGELASRDKRYGSLQQRACEYECERSLRKSVRCKTDCRPVALGGSFVSLRPLFEGWYCVKQAGEVCSGSRWC